MEKTNGYEKHDSGLAASQNETECNLGNTAPNTEDNEDFRDLTEIAQFALSLKPELLYLAYGILHSQTLAEDMWDSVMEKIVRLYAQNPIQYVFFKNKIKLRAYLRKSVKHLCFNERRNSARRLRIEEQGLVKDIFERNQRNADDSLSDENLHTLFNNAISELENLSHRQVLSGLMEEKMYWEMAYEQAVPIGTIMSRISRGRARLRKIIESDEQYQPLRAENLQEDHEKSKS